MALRAPGRCQRQLTPAVRSAVVSKTLYPHRRRACRHVGFDRVGTSGSIFPARSARARAPLLDPPVLDQLRTRYVRAIHVADSVGGDELRFTRDEGRDFTGPRVPDPVHPTPLHATTSSPSESRASAFRRSLVSKALPGTPWPAGSRWPPTRPVASTREGSRDFIVEELQADEIRSFAGSQNRPSWIFVAIEVWSRLWPCTVVGRRSYRNTLALLRDG